MTTVRIKTESETILMFLIFKMNSHTKNAEEHGVKLVIFLILLLEFCGYKGAYQIL